jgi:TetR/AcrR family transcriptional repressor of nem operon
MSKKDELLKAAEIKVRAGGYSNFSFRDLAAEVGIKSASVHYHFPTKSDLGAELARRYTDNFLNALGQPQDIISGGDDPISCYVDQFRTALVKDGAMCLCGLLGAETDGLPQPVKAETKRFFEKNIDWLEQAYKAKHPDNQTSAKINAIKTVSMLEGAMMISKTLNDNSAFEQAVAELD